MKYTNLHTHKSTNQENVLEIVNQYPNDFDPNIRTFSVGIHPWHIDTNSVEINLTIIENSLQLHGCLAIGECGLDKKIEMSLVLQIPIFEKQLLLAQKYNKPVIVHCVLAFQELIEIKNRLQITVPLIIHGFSKNEILGKQLLDNGFYFSFGKNLLLNPESEIFFEQVPNDAFFLETDSSDFSIEEIYQKASEFKNIDLKILKSIVYINFIRIFDLL